QLQILNKHTNHVPGIEFSQFSSCRYLCSGSDDKTIRLLYVKTYKSLYAFRGHMDCISCICISPSQGSYNNKSNHIGVVVEVDIQLVLNHMIILLKYVILKQLKNEGVQIYKSYNEFKICIRLLDIRSNEQTIFNGHDGLIYDVEYTPLSTNSNIFNPNIICSCAADNTILHIIECEKTDYGIRCLKFIELKKKDNKNTYYLNLFMVHLMDTYVFVDKLFFF
ncbi:hypothetical protein RFI_13857, partial [Reticulomyxa filosa]